MAKMIVFLMSLASAALEEIDAKHGFYTRETESYIVTNEITTNVIAPITLQIPSQYLNSSVFLDSYSDLNHELDIVGLSEHINNVSSTALECVDESLQACDDGFQVFSYGKLFILHN